MNEAALRAPFNAATPFTVGLEEEVMLLDPADGSLRPCARELLDGPLAGDRRFKPELPAAHLEIATPPATGVAEAVEHLGRGREDLKRQADGIAAPAAAGVHPFSPAEGALGEDGRYTEMAAEYGAVARRQLVCALQVHVGVGPADRALAVYNELRGHLPLIAALGANAPVYCGADTGMASIRPKICEALPRQGVPPAIPSWAAHAADLEWCASTGVVPESGSWWWELRPHPRFGTLEVRVPDAQLTIVDAGAVAAFVQCLVAWISRRHDAGDLAPPPPTWRITENRWRAARHGMDASFGDLLTGGSHPAREVLHGLLAELEPLAGALGCADELAEAGRLARESGAARQREQFERAGARGLARWLADQY